MAVSRRRFLSTSGTAIAGLSFSAAASSAIDCGAAGIRVRKNVATLDTDSPEIKALKKAVNKMKALPHANATSWRRQAEIHGQILGGFGNCKHANWFFLPWHRGYLYHFEE